MDKPAISRGFRSFLKAYHPKNAVIITRDFFSKAQFEDVTVDFIPLTYLDKIFPLIQAC